MRIVVLSALQAGLDTLHALGDFPLSAVIGLARPSDERCVSGYIDMAPYAAARGLPYIEAESYGLCSPNDVTRLSALNFDLLLVLGWQRLVPGWLLSKARIGAIGAHGSMTGITGGRGRSPQVWALLLGATEFSVSLFWLTPGVDDGPLIATGEFALTPYDDISSSLLKTARLVAKLLGEALADGRLGRDAARRPQDAEAGYWPKRSPQDGALDWRRSTEALYNFIRAQTRPYPGAYSDLGPNDGVLRIWRAKPFDTRLPAGIAAGTIVQRTAADALLVATGDGLLLVEDYELESPGTARLSAGRVLPSVDFAQQLRGILDRHLAVLPEFPLAKALLRQLENTAQAEEGPP